MRNLIRKVLNYSFMFTASLSFLALNCLTTTGDTHQQIPLAAKDVVPLNSGDKVPGIVLKLPDNRDFDLGKAVKQSLTVLIFYRGGW